MSRPGWVRDSDQMVDMAEGRLAVRKAAMIPAAWPQAYNWRKASERVGPRSLRARPHDVHQDTLTLGRARLLCSLAEQVHSTTILRDHGRDDSAPGSRSPHRAPQSRRESA